MEINSSFYRQHKRAVYERWAGAVPEQFRFSVKLPRAITHDQALVAADVLLDVFLDEVSGLGPALGALLVQLPASQPFVAEIVDEFLVTIRERFTGPVVMEPRHPAFFTATAEKLLLEHRVTLVAADPACVPEAAAPGGWPGITYYRWHGSPRMYWSSYDDERLRALASALGASGAPGNAWCIFDNTASGAAAANALTLQRIME